jgi:hypothetical protein
VRRLVVSSTDVVILVSAKATYSGAVKKSENTAVSSIDVANFRENDNYPAPDLATSLGYF